MPFWQCGTAEPQNPHRYLVSDDEDCRPPHNQSVTKQIMTPAAKKKSSAPKARKRVAPLDTPLRLEWRDPAELADNPSNWRTHPDSQLAAISDVIDEVGWAGACLYNEATGRLIDGHARKKIGKGKIPVLIGRWTEDQERKILATLDPLAAMAEANAERLDALLREVNTGSEAIQAMLAELADEAGLYQDKSGEGEGDDEPPANPVVRVGDRIEMGEHVLVCGNSTDQATVDSLIGDQRPKLMIVDPPFDLQYGQWDVPESCDVLVVWGRGDERLKWEAATLVGKYGLHDLVFTGGVRGQHNATLPCCLHDVVHVWRRKWWGKSGHKAIDAKVIRECGCAKTDDCRPRSVQDHCGGSLTGAGGMSWGKPVLSMQIAMAYVPAGSLVWDPCAGSGSSLVAAQRHGRLWRGCELQPQWTELCVQRWEAESGLTATIQRGRKVLTFKDLRAKVTAARGADTPRRPKHEQAAKEPGPCLKKLS